MQSITSTEGVFGLCPTQSGFWYCRANDQPRHVPGSPLDYAGVFQGSVLRIFGGTEHAAVSAQLHGSPLADRVRVASPVFAQGLTEPKDQAQLASRLPNYPTVIGGWRPFDAADATLFRLADARGVPALRAGAAMHHPIWEAVQFIRGLSPLALADWLEVVRDPRWFVDPAYPESTSKLEAFLGLRPTTQRAVFLRPNKLSGDVGRCRLTLACWFDDRTCASDPRNFLMRIYNEHLREGRARELAATRASQVFVRFVRAAWLDALRPKHTTDRLFDPRDFLKGEEVSAYGSFTAGATAH